jgi:hypothetical protein
VANSFVCSSPLLHNNQNRNTKRTHQLIVLFYSESVPLWTPGQTASNINSIKRWQHRDSEKSSILDCLPLIDLMSVLTGVPGAAAQQVCSATHLSVIPLCTFASQVAQSLIARGKQHKTTNRGLQCNKNRPTEVTVTAFLNAKLQALLAPANALWLHQAEMSGAKGDSVLVREFDDALMPVGFLEVAMPGGSDKILQTFGYANNLAHVEFAGIVPIYLGGIVRLQGQVELRAYYGAMSEKDTQITADVLLFRDSIENGLGTVLHALYQWGATIHNLAEAVDWKGREASPNLVFHDKYVYKLYDYRYRVTEVADEDRRSSALPALLIEGAKIVASTKDFSLLRYPFINGGHRMVSSAQASDLVKKLGNLHAQGVAMGDIRLSNIIFHDSGAAASFIDFDFSGKPGEKRYPRGWVCDIDDGKRHADAKAGAILAVQHDTFALSAAFRFFKPQDSKHEDDWANALEALTNGSLNGFGTLTAFDLNNSKLCSLPSFTATGSPHRPPAPPPKPVAPPVPCFPLASSSSSPVSSSSSSLSPTNCNSGEPAAKKQKT